MQHPRSSSGDGSDGNRAIRNGQNNDKYKNKVSNEQEYKGEEVSANVVLNASLTQM